MRPANRRTRLAAAGLVVLSLGAADAARGQDFAACLAELRAQAAREGIRAEVFDAATRELAPDESVLKALDSQPEFSKPVRDYLAVLVNDRRIADGRRKLAAWSGVLDEAERKFAVDRHVLVAIWGVESNYGGNIGGRALVGSLATVSCFGRRQPYFRGELMAALRILQSGDVAPEQLTGSWAGAFGQTQFMPSTFHRVAIDFDGDGRRDIVGSVPDALGSTANYLRQAGWEHAEPWGYEVRLPARYAGPSGRRHRQSLDEWHALGVRRADGKPVTGEKKAALLLPAGARGPAFIVFRNFDVIYAYNASEAYALAILHLADRLRGGGGFRAAWPVDDQGLSQAQRIELQEILLALGYDVGRPDGIIGARTMEAIKAFQRDRRLPVDGYADWRVLAAVRTSPAPQVP